MRTFAILIVPIALTVACGATLEITATQAAEVVTTPTAVATPTPMLPRNEIIYLTESGTPIVPPPPNLDEDGLSEADCYDYHFSERVKKLWYRLQNNGAVLEMRRDNPHAVNIDVGTLQKLLRKCLGDPYSRWNGTGPLETIATLRRQT